MRGTNAVNRRREVALNNLKARKDPNERALKEIKVLEERIKSKSKGRKYIGRAPSVSKMMADAAASAPTPA